jgi:hypothetical protein
LQVFVKLLGLSLEPSRKSFSIAPQTVGLFRFSERLTSLQSLSYNVDFLIKDRQIVLTLSKLACNSVNTCLPSAVDTMTCCTLITPTFSRLSSSALSTNRKEWNVVIARQTMQNMTTA